MSIFGKILATFSIVVIVLTTHGSAQTSAAGDVVGQMAIGYQGWFGTQNDGSPLNVWTHWGKGVGTNPAKGLCHFELYPDMREYTQHYGTRLGPLGNGQPSTLFSSFSDSTLLVHFRWMVTYGFQVISFQRFAAGAKQNPVYAQHINLMANKIRINSESSLRKFYIQYDVSGWLNYTTELLEDLDLNLNRTLNIFASRAYARQNGKLVIAIFGFGITGKKNDVPGDLNIINQLKQRGFYVIGMVSFYWRTLDGSSFPNYQPVYNAFNMIAPWTVGTYNDIASAQDYQRTRQLADVAYCKANKMDYQSVVYPGFAWSNWAGGPQNAIPRRGGTFMWEQCKNLVKSNITSFFIAMFDEYDEATAIAKAATDASMIPIDQYFLTLGADNITLSSDFYCRLARDCTQMVQKRSAYTETVPTGRLFDIPAPARQTLMTGLRQIIMTAIGLSQPL